MIDNAFWKICKTNNLKLKNLFKKGNELLEEELDIITILKSIRILKNE